VTHAATVRVPVASGAPAPWPLGWAALLLGVLYYFGARIGFLLTPSPAPVSTLWPPNAILLAALALSGVRRWPALLVATLLAHVAVELQSGVPLPMVLSWFVSNSTEALVGAIAMRRLMHDNIRLDTVRRVGIFVLFAGVIAPLVSSFLDAAFVQWNNWGSGTYWTVWRDRFFSNVLAILAIVPVAITWRNRGVQFIRSVSAWRAFEAALLVLGLLAVCVAVFAMPAAGFESVPVMILAPMPFLLWAAVRFGPAGSSFCLLIFALLSIWGAMQGFGPFAGHPMAENILPLQLFLILTYIPILGLTAVIKERASAVEVARSSEERLNLALSAAQIRTWDWDIGSKAWSDKANEVLGITSEVLGIPANGSGAAPNGSDAVSAGDRASVRAAIARAIERGTPYEAEFRIDRPDGSSQWVLGKGTVVTDRVGRPARMIGVNVDVTERKRAEIALRDEASLRESEARFRELADAMPQVVFTARPDGQIEYVNRKWADLTGVTTEIRHNRQLLSVLHPVDRASFASAWRASVESGVPHEYQGRLWSVRSGTFRWHLVRALPVRNQTGRIVRWYGTATDIDDHKRIEQALRHTQVRLRAFQRGLEHRVKERTAELSQANSTLREEVVGRVRTEQALRASEERFAKAFRAMPDAISIARRPEARLIEINERWEAMFGYSRGETIGRTLDELQIFADAEERDRFASLTATQGFVRELEVDLRDKHGAHLKGVVAVETVDVGGEPCLITMIRDITEKQRAEQEVEMQRRQLAHLGRVALVGELSGALAHELNQPLAAILANARAARRMLDPGLFDPQELRAILDDIVADDRRAADVIRRVRALIRRDEAELQPVMLNDVVNDVLDLAHSDLVERMVAVTTEFAGQLPEIQADRVQLQQVVLNLIVNACDAMSQTPPHERRITITTADEGEVVHLAVSDRGTGIRSDAVENVFEPFVTSKENGLGLGLTICRSIVDAHGGRLYASNNDDRGATFHMVLPHGAPGADDQAALSSSGETFISPGPRRA
jgi:PAS domain S-box-containing protein